jgi:hypothetical protein
MTDEEMLEKYKDKRTKCTVWTRVMGYHRPVGDYNLGKKGEFAERKWFVEELSKARESKDVEDS